MNIERDKFLTEEMGKCWHENKTIHYPIEGLPEDTKCSKCSAWNAKNLSFSTWEGFGKLWELAIKQE